MNDSKTSCSLHPCYFAFSLNVSIDFPHCDKPVPQPFICTQCIVRDTVFPYLLMIRAIDNTLRPKVVQERQFFVEYHVKKLIFVKMVLVILQWGKTGSVTFGGGATFWLRSNVFNTLDTSDCR